MMLAWFLASLKMTSSGPASEVIAPTLAAKPVEKIPLVLGEKRRVRFHPGAVPREAVVVFRRLHTARLPRAGYADRLPRTGVLRVRIGSKCDEDRGACEQEFFHGVERKTGDGRTVPNHASSSRMPRVRMSSTASEQFATLTS